MFNIQSIISVFSMLFIAIGVYGQGTHVAVDWNEHVLEAIRNDYARPTVHARNLLHSSIIMYDCWAAYDTTSSQQYLLGNTINGYTCDFDSANFVIPASLIERRAAQDIAMSYGVYRLIKHRYISSPQVASTMANISMQMAIQGLDTLVVSTDYLNHGPAALGNYVAEQMIAFGMQDGANEGGDYASSCYTAVNPNILPEEPGTSGIIDPNHWQPIELSLSIDQSGEIVTEVPPFLGPEWGDVFGFALRDSNLTAVMRDTCLYNTYHNQGPPVYLDTTIASSFDESFYKWGFGLVINWSGHLDPSDGVMWDVGPGSLKYDGETPPVEDFANFYDWERGGLASWHNEDGSFGGNGHQINPFTGLPYEPNIVPRGDYGRVIAEFWADGPDSETPPGHWFTLLNEFILVPESGAHRWRGQGPIIDDQEFNVKSYLALAGAMHDCAISAWSNKGYYDYIRPVSAIRYMAEKGQSTDASLSNYHPAGLPLVPGLIEIVGDAHPLADFGGVDHVGEIAIHAWKGPDYIDIPQIDEAGVDWILAEQWWPYQRPSFVTPPFAGYFSGHSAFSRAAAELFEMLTGSPYWPGGMAEWPANQNQFLVFEEGPSMTFNLQWATFMDASNESALSRIWGGIHPPVDDSPAREVGRVVGQNAFNFAETIVFPDWAMEFGGDGFIPSEACVGDFNADGHIGSADFILFLSAYGKGWTGAYDMDDSAEIGASDLLILLQVFGQNC
jgi:hypothetical protein